ncbi:hypothetical protein DEU56DRAFT_832402 [Suillus clintonianus]|uniref:uncharacterized protein n=1 Tax=Suillus clintonianus TaxID=1904413 RepID=UPI001B86CC7A|nr:uncharacterized protein DEU56DRAFT_832402 [Suillus clintonianus]KAG2122350.1 hypothetical protein DEU56DRAFT_832402 [Suillus clintonianus]
MSESATKSDLLPTNFVGTTMAGVQNEDGKFRVYYQNKEYQICEMQLDDPNSTTYKTLKLTTGNMPAARINTPIAAVAWDNLRQIRVYYVTVDSQVQEICYIQGGAGWHKGAHLGVAVENSTCMYAQHHSKEPVLRVGFQSSTAPQTITETCYYKSGWKTRVF